MRCKETFAPEAQVQFETAPELVCGIDLSTNGHKVSWSIADYLATLEKSAGELLHKEAKPEPKAEARAQGRSQARAKAEAKPEPRRAKPEPKAEAKPEPKSEPKNGPASVAAATKADH